MKVTDQTATRLVLSGVPGRRVWMIALSIVGAALAGAVFFFARLVYQENEGLSFSHIPLSIGVLIGLAMLVTGVVTLVIGRVSLTLDTATGKGAYTVVSPIVDAGKPCAFKLEHARSVCIEVTTESRPGRDGGAPTTATVHRARLRLTKPRRAITLDETEHGRLERLESVAEPVAAFLGLPLERDDQRADE